MYTYVLITYLYLFKYSAAANQHIFPFKGKAILPDAIGSNPFRFQGGSILLFLNLLQGGLNCFLQGFFTIFIKNLKFQNDSEIQISMPWLQHNIIAAIATFSIGGNHIPVL